ncbi:hypothetical protein ACTFIW_004494 [Dictyostelium discoideum]
MKSMDTEISGAIIESMAQKIKKSNENEEKIGYSKSFLLNKYRSLDKVSEAIYHTQIDLKQYKYMVNIPGERNVTLRKELENHLQKDDKIILSNNKFKILTDCKTQVLIYANAFNGVLKGVHRAIIKPKNV